MYSLANYGQMIADPGRFRAYSKAIQRGVRPGDTVLEIGCGPGVFAMLAAQAGARKVYAIDTEEIVHVARELAAANSLAGRMEFLQIDSRKLEIPARVDVIISDIRGSLPFFGQAIPALNDARDRLLGHSCRMIPAKDTLLAGLIEAEEFYCRLLVPWSQSIPSLHLAQAHQLLLNAIYTSDFRPEQMLTSPQVWAVLDYAAGADASASADINFLLTRSGIAHGVSVWFDTVLYEDIGYSSGPSFEKNIYGQVFLPWPEPVQVNEGQCIRVRLRANLVGDDYVWCWDTEIPVHGDQPARRFSQSTLQGAILSPESLRRRAADFVPSLSEQGQADRYLLNAIDGNTSLHQIAQSAATKFPRVFARWEDALSRAADLAAQFSR